jgi:hypothetical protein
MRKHKPEPTLTSRSDYSTRWALDEPGFDSQREYEISSPTVKPSSTGDIPLGQSGRRVKLTTILLQVTMLKMCGAISPSPHTSFCGGVIIQTYSPTLH